jgi:hypothetical protein
LVSRSSAAPALPVAGASIERDSLLWSVISVGMLLCPLTFHRGNLHCGLLAMMVAMMVALIAHLDMAADCCGAGF